MANMLVPTMALMLAVGPSNYILYKIAFTSYGASSALFAMQMVNLLFVVYGAALTPCGTHQQVNTTSLRRRRRESEW